MKTKKRFGELVIGESFEWGGKTLVKDGVRTATSITPKMDFVFTTKDMVTIEESVEEDDDDLMYGFGNIMGGSATAGIDLFDAYDRGDDSPLQDKCN